MKRQFWKVGWYHLYLLYSLSIICTAAVEQGLMQAPFADWLAGLRLAPWHYVITTNPHQHPTYNLVNTKLQHALASNHLGIPSPAEHTDNPQ